MKKLSNEVVQFLRDQGFVIVSTLDRKGFPHNSCKGIVEITPAGKIYLLDLYRGITSGNLARNQRLSITAVDEHRFRGYSLKGKGRLVHDEQLKAALVKAWEDRITSRVTQRILKNISGQKGHPRHPEVLMPHPKYLIAMEPEEVIDLRPHHLRQEE